MPAFCRGTYADLYSFTGLSYSFGMCDNLGGKSWDNTLRT